MSCFCSVLTNALSRLKPLQEHGYSVAQWVESQEWEKFFIKSSKLRNSKITDTAETCSSPLWLDKLKAQTSILRKTKKPWHLFPKTPLAF